MAKVRVAVLLLGIFWLFWSAGELRAEEIHPRIDSLYKLLDQESNESRQAELHFQIGQAYDQLSIESSEKGYKLKLDHFRKAQQYARPNRKPEYAIESLMEWMQWAREKENKLPSWEEYNQEIQPYLKTKAFGIYEADYLKELVLKARWQKQQGSEKKALDSYRDLIVKSNQDTLLNRYATLAFDWYKENNQLEVLTKWFKDRQTRLEKKQNLSGLQALHFGRAEIYNRLEDGPPAIEQWEKAAFYAGKLNRRLDQSAAWLRIGNYYRIDQAFPEAINYFKKSLVILDSLGKANFRSGNKPHLQRFIDVSVVLINLSSTAFAAEDYTSSAKYAEQAYQTANKWGLIHNKVLAACQWSAANCARGRESEQLLLLLKLLADDSLQFVADETKDRFLLQASLAEAFYLLRDYSEAIRYLNRNVTLHQTKLPNASWKAMDRTYELIYLCQKASGQQLLAFQSLQRLISMRDSVHEIEIKSNEEALLSRSLIEKKESQIEKLNRDKELGRLEGKRKQLLVWGLGALAFLLLIFVFYFFRRSGKRKLVQARLQELQSLKIQKSESLSSAYSEIQTTLQQVQQQTNDLEIQQIRIEDSIHYALRIQNAILPRQEILNQLLPDAYLLYRSREIISGDLYWWERHGKYLFIAVVDGAGHGVPGAFAGAAIFQLLDNTVQQNANETPEAILMLLDAELHHRNHGQSDDDREETFDIALIRIDLSDGKLLYSGAYRPILHVSEGKANELPCIRRSIGGEENTHRPFTQHSLQLKKGDRIALFTDGVTRQLGGNRRRAFTRNRLYRILNPAANPSKKTSNSLSRQGDLLHIELERWQGREKQLDDWLLLAIEW